MEEVKSVLKMDTPAVLEASSVVMTTPMCEKLELTRNAYAETEAELELEELA